MARILAMDFGPIGGLHLAPWNGNHRAATVVAFDFGLLGGLEFWPWILYASGSYCLGHGFCTHWAATIGAMDSGSIARLQLGP